TTVTISGAPTPAMTMHVGDLDGYNSSEGRTWSAYVIVRVEDSDHKPVADATVFGKWKGGGLASDECTTDSAGECLMVDTMIRARRKSVTFTVRDIVHASLTYAPDDNHDPDGDSDGTSIKVKRP
ncbi:MAG: hypothetical protein ACE5O2_15675, partial [Armatimonadota bacterium]